MFGFNMSIQRGIRQVSEATSATNKFSTLFIFSGFSDFLFFLVAVLFWNVFVVFDLVVVEHVHFLLTLDGSDNFLVVYFGHRVEVVLFFLAVVTIVAVVRGRAQWTCVASSGWICVWHFQFIFSIDIFNSMFLMSTIFCLLINANKSLVSMCMMIKKSWNYSYQININLNLIAFTYSIRLQSLRHWPRCKLWKSHAKLS